MRHLILVAFLVLTSVNILAQDQYDKPRPITELDIKDEYLPGAADPSYVNITYPKGVKEGRLFVFYTIKGEVIDNLSGYSNGVDEHTLCPIRSYDCGNTKMQWISSHNELTWNGQRIVSYSLR